MSSRAHDRELMLWFQKIKTGELKLPRFQRFEAWDKHRIASLLKTIINDLPLGITLILEVDNELFDSRYLETAEPIKESRVTEHLLDGQQRLTALWRILHNNYKDIIYFVYVPELDSNDKPWSNELEIFTKTRYISNNILYPIWVDHPTECIKRGLIPTNLLKPVDLQSEINEWIDYATKDLKPSDNDTDLVIKIQKYYNFKDKLLQIITKIRETIKYYNLPYLALDKNTDKDTALQVFINMNTNSKPLNRYDIIVAEVESITGHSLHDLQKDLDKKFPNVKNYESLNQLIITTSALLQEKMPNEKGAIDMNKSTMILNWKLLEIGLNKMADFLKLEGIFDYQRLPTNAVLAVLASILAITSDKGDSKGQIDILLKRYLWSSFFTDRYENSAATNAFSDFTAIKLAIENINNNLAYDDESIPVLNREKYTISSDKELLSVGWPKRANIRARAILAITTKLGARDFADGKKVTSENIKERDYHHIFPDALLKEANIPSYLALNCALITDVTNRHLIRRKDPATYIQDRTDWSNEETVDFRLKSHLIPIRELYVSNYENLQIEEKQNKIKIDFNNFLEERAKLIYCASIILCDGLEFDLVNLNKKYQELFIDSN